MIHRKLSNWAIFCLTVLAADLVAEIVVHWVGHYTKTSNPYKATAIKMAVAVVVFFPAFQLIEAIMKASTKRYVSKTKKAAGGGIYGVLFAFFLGLIVLYGFYLKVKFNINLLDNLF